MAIDDNSAEQWKQRYYASLAEFDRKELQWKEAEATLRRIMSRLSLAADGRNTKLDEQLERLRNVVRQEPSLERLQSMVEGILNVSSESESVSGAISPVDWIQKILARAPFPDSVSRQLKKLRSQLDRGRLDDDEILTQFLDLLDSAFRAVVPDGAGKGGGLLSRLFSSGERDRSEQSEQQARREYDELKGHVESIVSERRGQGQVDECDVGDIMLDLLNRLSFIRSDDSNLQTIRSHAHHISGRNDLDQLLGETALLITRYSQAQEEAGATQDLSQHKATVREILIQLLERLDLTPDMSQRAEMLKERWEKEFTDTDLPDALKSIASLITEMRSSVEREKHDFESFLKQLTDSLKDLDEHIQKASAGRIESLNNSRNLDRKIREQMSNIESSMRDAASIDVLKSNIQTHVDQIKTNMRLFLDAEEERASEADDKLKELVTRMQHLEQESSTLRNRIEEEHKQALIDPLTEVFNRLAYNEEIQNEYKRWKRYGKPLTLAVWDIDHFKRINDTYGHKAGDKALRTIAQLIQENLRETDFFARFGGEEFVALLPETSTREALVVAEKMRALVESSAFKYKGERVVITITCGLSEFSGDDTPETVFERADKNLYRGKKSGRNRCYADETG